MTDPEARLRTIDARKVGTEAKELRKLKEAQETARLYGDSGHSAKGQLQGTSAGHSIARGADANPLRNPPRYLGREVQAPLKIINRTQRPIPTLGGRSRGGVE